MTDGSHVGRWSITPNWSVDERFLHRCGLWNSKRENRRFDIPQLVSMVQNRRTSLFTPIFEGSIASYRVDAVEEIVTTSNADDSQLAVLIRNQGLRAISDESIRFTEAPITDSRESHNRTVRRGQGLSRHFWRHRSQWFEMGAGG